MPYRHRRNCPICGKQDLLYLSDHLRQLHQLSSVERQPFLKRALLSSQVVPLIPPPSVQDGMHSYPIASPMELPQNKCSLNTVNCLGTQAYPEFRFQHMFSMIVVGPSQCEKTCFVQ